MLLETRQLRHDGYVFFLSERLHLFKDNGFLKSLPILQVLIIDEDISELLAKLEKDFEERNRSIDRCAVIDAACCSFFFTTILLFRIL